MRPIVLFVIAAVAASAIGAASLNNVIELTVQQFGVGSQDIESPISAASVDFTIEAIPGQGELKNVITACSFHSADPMPGSSTVICKLTNIDHKVVAEGSKHLVDYAGSNTEEVIITTLAVAVPPSNLVNNIHDVTLVVVGDDPTP